MTTEMYERNVSPFDTYEGSFPPADCGAAIGVRQEMMVRQEALETGLPH
jgi:hypothetical protein